MRSAVLRTAPPDPAHPIPPGRSRPVRAALVLAALAACTLVLSGCVAAAKDGPGAAAKGSIAKSDLKCGAGTGQKATGTPIQVRAITTASGGVDFSSSTTAAAAYFGCLNANGGINGHPVSYQVGDDGFNPTKTGQLAAQYGADSTVVANVGDSTYSGCGVANVQYVKYGLYSITGVGVAQECFESSNIAPVNAGPRISSIGALTSLFKNGKAESVYLTGINTQATAWANDGLKAYAKANGIKVVGSDLTDPGESNFLPLLNKIKASGAKSVILTTPGPDAAATLAAAEKQGMKEGIAWACPASCYDAQFGAQVGDYWNGLTVDSELALTDSSGKDNELWKSVMDGYAASSAPRDTFSQAGFLAAKIFSDTLIEAKPATYDRPTVSKILLGIKNYHSDLECAPWYFGKADRHNADHATRVAVLTNGKYEQLSGCSSSEDPGLAAILEREKSQGLVG